MINDPMTDPMENDDLQQRQQMWNVAKMKPMVSRITPPPNSPWVALCQSACTTTKQTSSSYNHYNDSKAR